MSNCRRIAWTLFVHSLISATLLCQAEQVEYGLIRSDTSRSGSWTQVAFRHAFQSSPPIVVASLVSAETESISIEIQNITVAGFECRFTSSDANSPLPKDVGIAFVAAEEGEYEFAGLDWKVGTASISNTDLSHVFATPFPQLPVAFVQPLMAPSGSVGIASITDLGLNFRILPDSVTAPQTLIVQFICVESGSGTHSKRNFVAGATSGSPGNELDALFTSGVPQPVILTGVQTSNSSEILAASVSHFHPLGASFRMVDSSGSAPPPGQPIEAVGYFALGQGIADGDEGDSKLEFGELTLSQDDSESWYTLSFSAPQSDPTQRYFDPVVVVSPLTNQDPEDAQVRVRNLTATGCEIQIVEPSGSDGVHAAETFHWMVMESGTFSIGGRQWEAGTRIVRPIGREANFSSEFPSKPVLLVQTASDRNEGIVTVRVEDLTEDSATLTLVDGDAGTSGIRSEVSTFIALEQGKATMSPAAGMKFEVRSTSIPLAPGTHWRRIRFDETYAAPFLFFHVQDDDYPAVSTARLRGLTDRSVDLETIGLHSQTGSRDVGYLLIGDIADRDGDGIPDVWEIQHNLNPDNAADASLHFDEDGLSNLEEYLAGTNPHLRDTDGDGLDDDIEVESGLGFDPNNPDSDGDGLGDAIEYKIIMASQSDSIQNQAHVLPWDDFDGDGISNLDEQQAGTDPLDWYNGVQPVLTAIRPEDQSDSPEFAPVGKWLHRPMILRVTNVAGEPLAGAPVRFVVSSGNGRIGRQYADPHERFSMRDLILKSNTLGLIEFDWMMGPSPNTVQTVHAFTAVAGKLQLQTYLAYSIATQDMWDIDDAITRWTPFRNVTVEQLAVSRWKSVRDSNSTSFTFEKHNSHPLRPNYLSSGTADHRPWLSFNGSQRLAVPSGALPPNSSFFIVVAPDETISPQPAQNPTSPSARLYSLQGLSAAPESNPLAPNLGPDQLYPIGTQRYLLSGYEIPSGQAPHQYIYHPATWTGEERFGSRYIHKEINSNKYNGFGLGTKARPNVPLDRRYDATDATRLNDLQNGVVRYKNKTLSEVVNNYKNYQPVPGYHWIHTQTWDPANHNPGGSLKFTETVFRLRQYKNAGNYWTLIHANISNVIPSLSVGNDGTGYFEVQSVYAPQLASQIAPSSAGSGKGRVLTIETLPDGRRSLRWDGEFASLGHARAGGIAGDWRILGSLPDGSQGYSGKLGDIVVFSNQLSSTRREFIEDRLAAAYRLGTPNRNSDGFPDWWVRFLLGGDPAAGDLDGLSLSEEFALGTHPMIMDSDGDGINDHEEHWMMGTSPLHPDSDMDGFPDNVDLEPLNPSNGVADLDGNGLSDGLDFVLANYTAVNSIDSDGDGIDDAWEIAHGLDPNDPTDALLDWDNDGLNNLGEFLYGTDPNNPDSNNDGVGDGQQIAYGNFLPQEDSSSSATDQTVTLTWPASTFHITRFFVQKSRDDGATWEFAGIASPDAGFYTVAGLEQDTQYLFRIRVVSALGEWTTNHISARTQPTVPDSPVGVEIADATATSAIISWHDMSQVETDFIVERRRLPDGDWTLAAISPENSTTAIVEGLAGASSYEFRVVARNGSLASPASASVMLPTLPEPVTDASGVWTLSGENSLTWESPEDMTRTAIRIRRSLAHESLSPILVDLFPDLTTYLDTNVAADTEYRYQISALNLRGEAPGIPFYIATGNSFGNAPSDVTGIPAGPRAVNLTWTDQTADESGFYVERAAATNPDIWIQSPLLPPNSTYYEDRSNLQEGQHYLYRVVAVKNSLRAVSEIVEVTTPSFTDENMPPESLALISQDLSDVLTSAPVFEAIVGLPDEGEFTDAKKDGEFAEGPDGRLWFQRVVPSTPSGALPANAVDYYHLGNGSSSYGGTLLPPGDAGADSSFGACVVASGEWLAIGAPTALNGEGIASGKVYVYQLSGPAPWIPNELSPANGQAGDQFGASVSIDGSRMIIGSPGRDKEETTGPISAAGSVHLFERTGESWGFLREEWAQHVQADAQFGFSVSVAGGNYAVGAPFANDILEGESGLYHLTTASGQVQIARWNGSGKLTLGNLFALFSDVRSEIHGLNQSHFGYSVAIDDRYRLAIGMPDSSWTSGDDLFGMKDGNVLFAQWSGSLDGGFELNLRWIAPGGLASGARFGEHVEGADYFDFGIGLGQTDSQNRTGAYFGSLAATVSPGTIINGVETPYTIGEVIAEQQDSGSLTFSIPEHWNPIEHFFEISGENQLEARESLKVIPEGLYRIRISVTDDRGGFLERVFPLYITNSEVQVDTDNDGIPDDWEIANGLNPNDPNDASSDRDGDGFTALQEYQRMKNGSLTGSDPNRWDLHPWGDLDGDGIINSQDAAPMDPNVGILNIQIDHPSNDDAL